MSKSAPCSIDLVGGRGRGDGTRRRRQRAWFVWTVDGTVLGKVKVSVSPICTSSSAIDLHLKNYTAEREGERLREVSEMRVRERLREEK
ncbi:unnamed protein product [Camellia sinensis]